MADAQWPLSAAASRLLLVLPAAGTRPHGLGSGDTDSIKLTAKELLVRGGLGMTVQPRRWGGDHVMFTPGAVLDPTPPPVAVLQAALWPHLPGEAKEVFRSARARNRQLLRDVTYAARDELSQRGLVEEAEYKRAGFLSARGLVRTASGDAWAASAGQYLERLHNLEHERQLDPDAAARLAVAAAAMTVMVPAAMAPMAREHWRLRDNEAFNQQYRGAGDAAFVGASDPGGFDVLGGVGDLVDSALGGAMEGIDSALDGVGSALDSAAGSIDSAIDSGVGGDFGGGDGGGGGGGDGGGGP